MKKAKFIFFVSEYMRKHYEELGRCSFENKSYIMPCFNEVLDESVFKQKKYTDLTFCYVGSLDLWQCFRETVQLYKSIEYSLQNTKLKVLTFSVDEGTRILKEYGVQNFEIKQVPKEQVKQELIESSFGFIIRHDNMVNRVATPTKFSSYLSAGVIPIYSSCLTDFDALSKSEGMKYVLGISQEINPEEIVTFIKRDVVLQEICDEYKRLFSSYYSIDYHTCRITKLLKNKEI